MKEYIDLANKILEKGNYRGDRTGTGTVSIFGPQLRFDLTQGFPLLTTKKMFVRGIIEELLWFLNGDTNNNILVDKNVHIWDEWQLNSTDINFGENFDKREIVYVEPIIKEYQDYYNPNSNLQIELENDSVDSKLRNLWSKMMDRCYNINAHNYIWYGGKNIFVDSRWHKLETFLEDVKKLPNWKYKLDNWNDYNLDKDYYSSNCYSPETCLWLSKKENGIYGSKNNAIIVISPTGQSDLYLSIQHASKILKISKSSIHRFKEKLPEILKGNNKSLRNWKFIAIEQPFRYSIPEQGSLGPVYGKQWRSWGKNKVTAKQVLNIIDKYTTININMVNELVDLFKNPNSSIDQIQILIDGLKKKPFSRRHIVSAWNVEDLPDETISPQENVKNGKMALAPCHCLFQFYVREMDVNDRIREWNAHNPENELDMNLSDSEIMADLDARNAPKYRLDCQLYQRSADYILGVPFNIASYALFTMMVAQCVNMLPGEFIHTFGDCHIYKNHIETYIASQMDNTPYELPTMIINPEKKDIFSFTIDDFKLDDYQSHKKIDYPISI